MELNKKAVEMAAEKLKGFAVNPDDAIDMAEIAIEAYVSAIKPCQLDLIDDGAPMKCPSAWPVAEPLSELQAVSIMMLAYIKHSPNLPCYGNAMEAAWRALRERLYPAEKSPEARTEKE